jgi:hypothetical protein
VVAITRAIYLFSEFGPHEEQKLVVTRSGRYVRQSRPRPAVPQKEETEMVSKLASRVALVSVLAFTGSVWADASVYVVHGIPGGDLGLDPDLPVDVSVNGACALQDFRFGDIVGPIDLPAGSYDIAISAADPDDPCGNPPLISVSGLMLEDDVSYSIVAHLDADGGATASAFANNVDPTGRGKARLIAHHTAAAPAVDVTISREADGTGPSLTIEDFANGDQTDAEVRPGDWWVSIAPADANTPVFGPAPVELEPYTAYLVYAVGSVETGSFTLLVQPISGLKPAPFGASRRMGPPSVRP